MLGANAVNAQSSARMEKMFERTRTGKRITDYRKNPYLMRKMEKMFNKAGTGKRITDYRENPYFMGKTENKSLRSRAIGAYRQSVAEHSPKLGEIENTLRFVQEKLESMIRELESTSGELKGTNVDRKV